MKNKSLPIPPQPKWFDVLILSVFSFLITLHPHYLHAEINLYELGLYLPGIDTVLRGEIPFRDCFHLRGPFELYIPALLMKWFGENVSVLSAYFYAGTVIGLIACVILGAQLYRTRFILYLMVPVLIARTFPRVAFTFWGGMRFAFGLFAIAAAVQFFKTQKYRWLFISGILSACALFTSVEIGVCAVFGVSVALIFAWILKILDLRIIKKAALTFAAGGLLVAAPFLLYLAVNQALLPYVDNVLTVVTRMQKTFDLNYTMQIPQNFQEAFLAMIDPVNKNFRQLTPAYFYIFLLVYFVWKIRQKRVDNIDLAVVCLAGYGILLYNTAFRHIWAYQFEMALQPEKVLLFFILEHVYFRLREKRAEFKHSGERLKMGVAYFLIVGLIVSSLSYAFQRYSKRFVAYKFFCQKLAGKDTANLYPLHGKEYRTIKAERAKGMVAPIEQVEEIEKLADFFNNNTRPGEKIFIFPELGFYSFIIDRPFLGRFPMVTMAWFKEPWHEEFMKDLKSEMPQYAIVDKDPGPAFPAIFFKLERNKKKYDEVLEFVHNNYTVVDETSGTLIYKRKK